MTNAPPTPSEFLGAVEDYATHVEDEQYVRVAYASQLAATAPYIDRDPLNAVEFVASLVANAGVELDAHDRDRLEHAYSQQLEAARNAGESR